MNSKEKKAKFEEFYTNDKNCVKEVEKIEKAIAKAGKNKVMPEIKKLVEFAFNAGIKSTECKCECKAAKPAEKKPVAAKKAEKKIAKKPAAKKPAVKKTEKSAKK